MYTIRQASQRTGLSATTIRAWERRYGVVRPARTGSGYRLYDEEALASLDAMRRLVASGWRASLAAAAIAEHGATGLRPPATFEAAVAAAVAAGTSASGIDGGPPAVDIPDLDRLIARFVVGAAALDDRMIGRTLDDLFARGSFERVVSSILFPALARLGDAWEAGTVGVAGEHLASGAVVRRLAAALEAAGRASGPGPSVIVGLPPGGRHEIGALAFAVAARRAGLRVAYLGMDLPVADWVTAAVDATAAVIGVVTARDRRAAAEVAQALRAARPELVIALGGRAARPAAGAIRLPDDLESSVATLARAIVAEDRTPDASG